MLKNSSFLITGGTGSFGHSFVPTLLKRYNPKRLVIFSRDEMKQWEMAKIFKNDSRVRFFLGDVRDKNRLHRALNKIDCVIHAAAIKIVPSAEYNPFECIKTNIIGAMNLIDASIDQKVKKVVALSTDKACSPINLYGATKLASDKLFISGDSSYAGGIKTSFSVVRYGNVMGSRGSVIPLFFSLKNQKEIPITDKRMTRFMITLEQGVDLVCHALEDMKGGEIYVKKIPSIKVIDIAKVIAPNAKLKFIGIRPGEKLHEKMISKEDADFTFEYDTYYKIFSMINRVKKNKLSQMKGKKVPYGFSYRSDTNNQWMTKSELKKWISNNKIFFNNI
jgi:UDP-N-acetylglucosamine 4,6-dehydratase